jgi:hypothetical protein
MGRKRGRYSKMEGKCDGSLDDPGGEEEKKKKGDTETETTKVCPIIKLQEKKTGRRKPAESVYDEQSGSMSLGMPRCLKD